MKRLRIFLLLAAALGSALAADPASAWHRGGPRVSVGVSFGMPFAAFPYYYPPYPHFYPAYYPAYYPAPIVVQQAPVTYVEQPQPQVQAAAPSGYWYFCNDARAYYPYVKECPGGWQRVAPQPAQ